MLRTPFWKFVIQNQTWTATTTGIAQTRTRPAVRATRTIGLICTSSSAISVPRTMVKPTVAAVNTTVRSERVPEDVRVEDEREVVETDPLALALDQLEEAVLLERELDEVVERIGEDRPDDDDCRQQQPVRGRGTGDAPKRQRAAPPRWEGCLGGYR